MWSRRRTSRQIHHSGEKVSRSSGSPILRIKGLNNRGMRVKGVIEKEGYLRNLEQIRIRLRITNIKLLPTCQRNRTHSCKMPLITPQMTLHGGSSSQSTSSRCQPTEEKEVILEIRTTSLAFSRSNHKSRLSSSSTTSSSNSESTLSAERCRTCLRSRSLP